MVMNLKELIVAMCEEYRVPYKIWHSDIIIRCPFHDDNKPSLHILFEDVDGHEKGENMCFPCGHGYPLKDIFDAYVDDSFYERHDMYWDDDIDPFMPKLKLPKISELPKWDTNPLLKLEQSEYSQNYPTYLSTRRITMDTARRYGVGYDKSTHSVTFPLYDHTERLVGITRRDTQSKKYHYPSNTEKGVYLIESCIKELESDYRAFKRYRPVFVCESQINALTLCQWGYNAIALFGTGCESQYKYIERYLPEVKFFTCFDGDNAGRNGARKWKKWFPNSIQLPIPNGKDVNDLTEKEFREILNSVIV